MSDPILPPQLLVILGSDSDKKYVKEPVLDRIYAAANASKGQWNEWEVEFDIASAHRSPELVRKICKESKSQKTVMVLAIGGAAFALPGVMASELAYLPVCSLPLDEKEKNVPFVSAACLPPGTPAPSFNTNDYESAATYMINYMDEIVPILAQKPQFSVCFETNSNREKITKTFQSMAPAYGINYDIGVGIDLSLDVMQSSVSLKSGMGSHRILVIDIKETDLKQYSTAPIIARPGTEKNAVLHIARMLAPWRPEVQKALLQFADENYEKVVAADKKLRAEYNMPQR